MSRFHPEENHAQWSTRGGASSAAAPTSAPPAPVEPAPPVAAVAAAPAAEQLLDLTEDLPQPQPRRHFWPVSGQHAPLFWQFDEKTGTKRMASVEEAGIVRTTRGWQKGGKNFRIVTVAVPEHPPFGVPSRLCDLFLTWPVDQETPPAAKLTEGQPVTVRQKGKRKSVTWPWSSDLDYAVARTTG